MWHELIQLWIYLNRLTLQTRFFTRHISLFLEIFFEDVLHQGQGKAFKNKHEIFFCLFVYGFIFLLNFGAVGCLAQSDSLCISFVSLSVLKLIIYSKKALEEKETKLPHSGVVTDSDTIDH